MELKVPKSEKSTTKQEDEEMKQAHGMIYHLDCYSYWEPRHELEKVITEGCQRFCPGWGAGGVKDLNCTHMKWSKCKVIYCYCWGIEQSKLDIEKDNAKPNGEFFLLYQHNKNWDTNENRWPMYLNYIYKVDKDWINDTMNEYGSTKYC